MRIRGLSRLHTTVQQLRNRFRPGVLILLYHRVTELSSDPYLLSVTPQHFAEHMEVIRQQNCLMSLPQLVQALQDGRLPQQAIVVTFDDGYTDNLDNAKPLLEQYDIPATVFVASGYVGQEREFWWDEVERLLLQPGTLPETLQLTVKGKTYQWHLEEASHYSEADAQRDRTWHLYQDHDPTSRHRLFRALHKLLDQLPIQEKWQVLDQVATWTEIGFQGRPSHRMMNAEQLTQLADGGLVEVGAHTVTHPVLSQLSIALQQHEIYQSKADLEEILNRPVTSFAYPHGSRADYTADSIAIAQATGFHCACSNFIGLVRLNTDPFQLPRVLVKDYDGETFARHLKDWFRE